MKLIKSGRQNNYCSGISMRNNRFTTWFLLGYLALLLNVGPSAHYADFFGFHHHHHESVALDSHGHGDLIGLGISGDCCCHDQHSNESGKVNSAAGEDGLVADSSCGDCLLCHYFDHFQSIDISIDFHLEETPCCESLASPIAKLLFRFVDSSARGPPAFFLG